ncbi:hypothetical protein QNO07_03675 [Streptomyces sp. 549]|uniref:hypothetical protein n=1 Tax=Streptomyces sp. 549 TaxID=3049076 RepID=UPI0024C24CDC|nr:hypothetical protein [Streptomyces sp. 549]MDK1472534.1 hypothetical protein [Streptomyces sp. 549]
MLRKQLAHTAGIVATALALVMLLPGSASAKTIHFEKARKTSSTIKFDANCLEVLTGRQAVGLACFQRKGTKLWVKDLKKDGAHIEIRGEVLDRKRDGFRCYGTGGGGSPWHVCDSFGPKMSKGHYFAWSIVLVDGEKIVGGGEMKLSLI